MMQLYRAYCLEVAAVHISIIVSMSNINAVLNLLHCRANSAKHRPSLSDFKDYVKYYVVGPRPGLSTCLQNLART